MKSHDQHTINSTKLGLDKIFFPIGNDSFIIKSECILSINNVITTGNTYVLMTNNPDGGFNVQNVELIDVYFDNVNLNIVVNDIKSNCIETIVHNNYCNNIEGFYMLLFDWDYLQFVVEKKTAIKNYCGCD